MLIIIWIILKQAFVVKFAAKVDKLQAFNKKLNLIKIKSWEKIKTHTEIYCWLEYLLYFFFIAASWKVEL